MFLSSRRIRVRESFAAHARPGRALTLAVAVLPTLAPEPSEAATLPAFCDTTFVCAVPGGAVYLPEANFFLASDPDLQFVVGVEIDQAGTLLNPTPADLFIADVVEGSVREVGLTGGSIDFTFDVVDDPMDRFGETVFASVLFDPPIASDFATALADDAPLVDALAATLRFDAPDPVPVPASAAMLLSALVLAGVLRFRGGARSGRV